MRPTDHLIIGLTRTQGPSTLKVKPHQTFEGTTNGLLLYLHAGVCEPVWSSDCRVKNEWMRPHCNPDTHCMRQNSGGTHAFAAGLRLALDLTRIEANQSQVSGAHAEACWLFQMARARTALDCSPRLWRCPVHPHENRTGCAKGACTNILSLLGVVWTHATSVPSPLPAHLFFSTTSSLLYSKRFGEKTLFW